MEKPRSGNIRIRQRVECAPDDRDARKAVPEITKPIEYGWLNEYGSSTRTHKNTVDLWIANARAIFLRKIKPTIDREGEIA
jgi:hypothetical protein